MIFITVTNFHDSDRPAKDNAVQMNKSICIWNLFLNFRLFWRRTTLQPILQQSRSHSFIWLGAAKIGECLLYVCYDCFLLLHLFLTSCCKRERVLLSLYLCCFWLYVFFLILLQSACNFKQYIPWITPETELGKKGICFVIFIFIFVSKSTSTAFWLNLQECGWHTRCVKLATLKLLYIHLLYNFPHGESRSWHLEVYGGELCRCVLWLEW